MNREIKVWTTAELLEELKASEARIEEHKARIVYLEQEIALFRDRSYGQRAQITLWQDAAMLARRRVNEWRYVAWMAIAVAAVMCGAFIIAG